MLTTEPAAEMAEQWKAVFKEYKSRLRPNKKSGGEVVEYLKSKYPMSELLQESAKQTVYDNIMLNEFFADKIPTGESLKAEVFEIGNSGAGKALYEMQDSVFRKCRIIVGIEYTTAFVFVEGSSYLFDELVAFQGLDELDMTNCFLVAQYVSCLKRFGILDKALQGG